MRYDCSQGEFSKETLLEMESVVFDYWDAAREGAFAPPWSRFHLDELPPRAVPWCSVLDVEPDPLDFVVRFWGSMRRDLFGQEITGRKVSAGTNLVSETMFYQNARVVMHGKPMYFMACASSELVDEVEYGFLRLPLSDDGKTVTKVFSISYHPDLRTKLHALHGTLPHYGNAVLPRARRG